ncbi:MAG: right-handed parallel beta-helix repeat-containing protein, partial [Myxococcales bacterium]|nr:right-handed parallel beta-helix repeat-containing protein [Myxococcales bacterium]
MRSTAAALFALSLSTCPASAQDCDCDHVVGLTDTIFDGRDTPVAPGDRICVTAGTREFLRFRHVQGTAEAPVEIINCGGRVVIHNEDRAYALVFEEDSQHFHVTGTGDPAIEHGFDISCPDTEPYPGIGLWLLGRSTDYEADHMEIHDTGFAGVSAKTDPLCDGSADQGVFVQRNASIHHLWVHDTGGEGFYVGSTQSDGQTITCDGASEVHQPHFLEGIELHDNLVENTGWDGMQVGMARSGCRVYRNVIRHVGLAGELYQQQGLQIGTFSACEVFANVIEDGPAMGIIVLGAGETFIHSNLIVGFTMADGIYANHSDRVPGAAYRIAFNTIVGWDRNGITVFGPNLAPSEAVSNLLVGSGDGIGAGGDVAWREDGNLVFGTEAEAGFVGGGDYHLAVGSSAIGAGVPVAGVAVDLDGYPRADPPAAGAFEYRDPSVDAGPIGFDVGTPPPPRDAGPG